MSWTTPRPCCTWTMCARTITSGIKSCPSMSLVISAAGVPQFARLQNRMHVKAPSAALIAATPVTLYLFDILRHDGHPVTGWPYRRRRDLLDTLDLDNAHVRVPPAFLDAEPADVYNSAVDNALEGVVCKRLNSTYQPGRRSPDWIKVPVALTQEVIIIGWQPGAGRRAGMIGALLLAVHEPDGRLTYVGKVGTGFTDAALRTLAADVATLGRATQAVTDVPRVQARTAHWVEPSLVGEVVFRNITPDGRLRHPRWRGLRTDKTPDEVVRVSGR